MNVQNLLGNMLGQTEGDATGGTAPTAAAAFGKKAGKASPQAQLKKGLMGTSSKASAAPFGEQLSKEMAQPNADKAQVSESENQQEHTLQVPNKHGDEIVVALSQRGASHALSEGLKLERPRGNKPEKEPSKEESAPQMLGVVAPTLTPSLVDMTIETLTVAHDPKMTSEKTLPLEATSKSNSKAHDNQGAQAIDTLVAAPSVRTEPFPDPLSPPPVANTSGGSGVSEPAPEVQLFAASLPAPALEDPSLRAALLPNVANLMVETADAGALSVRLQVRDGVTDIQLSGPAAPVVEARESEIRVALASEGLALGNLDLTQRDSSSNARREQDDLPSRATWQTASSPQFTSMPAATSNSGESGSGRVHIKA